MLATPKNIWFHIATSVTGPDFIANQTSNASAKLLKKKVLNTTADSIHELSEVVELSLCTIKTDKDNKKARISPDLACIKRIRNKGQLKQIPDYLNELIPKNIDEDIYYICTESISTLTIIICHLGSAGTHLIEICDKIASKEQINNMLESKLSHFCGSGVINELATMYIAIFLCKMANSPSINKQKKDIHELHLLARFFVDKQKRLTL